MSFEKDMEAAMQQVERRISAKTFTGTAVKTASQLTRQTLPQDVHETCGQASNLVARIMDMADRLCGPVPSAGGTGSEVNAPVVGEFGQMRERLSATREGLASANDALDRIERELL